MMEDVSEHVGTNYPKICDSISVAQLVDDFLFPWEENRRSAENSITKDEDEGFSETRAPQNNPPQQPPSMEPRPLCVVKRNSRTLLLLYSSLINFFCK